MWRARSVLSKRQPSAGSAQQTQKIRHGANTYHRPERPAYAGAPWHRGSSRLKVSNQAITEKNQRRSGLSGRNGDSSLASPVRLYNQITNVPYPQTTGLDR